MYNPQDESSERIDIILPSLRQISPICLSRRDKDQGQGQDETTQVRRIYEKVANVSCDFFCFVHNVSGHFITCHFWPVLADLISRSGKQKGHFLNNHYCTKSMFRTNVATGIQICHLIFYLHRAKRIKITAKIHAIIFPAPIVREK